MDALMQVMRAKKREVSLIQAQKQEKREKYLRRGEVESILMEQQIGEDENPTKEQQQQAEQKGEHKASDQLQHSSDNQQTTASKKQQLQQKEEEEVEKVSITLPEIKRRLRSLGEPVTLFGESASDRLKRLRRLEIEAAYKQEEELGAGHDIHNAFVGHQESADRAQQEEDDEEEDRADQEEEDARERKKRRVGGNGGDDVGNGAHTGGEKEGKSNEGGQEAVHGEEEEETQAGEDEDPHRMVYRFFKRMLQLWEKDLANRPDQIKRTAQGKMATKTMKQCKDYIRPLFKLCKSHNVPEDILPNLIAIVKFCQQGEFVQANDQYIKLAIGNAAWPIGVTMVGIHERTGREKINANKQAHVMNNECQRKYLTSVKRLISYSQSIAKVPPSKKVS